jgi:hypothetical protein
MAVPKKDSALGPFALSFAAIVSAAPATYNMTATQCTALTTATNGFISAYNASSVDGMKSKSLTAAKDSAKAALLLSLRSYYGQISAMTSVTDQQKINLGITVRKVPSPTPAPSSEPLVSLLYARGRTVRMRLRDADSTAKRGKPPGVSSATILSYVGATPPADMGAWKFESNVSRTLIDVTFPASTPAGAQVWFTVFWSNKRDQSGPASEPVCTYLQAGSVGATEAA